MKRRLKQEGLDSFKCFAYLVNMLPEESQEPDKKHHPTNEDPVSGTTMGAAIGGAIFGGSIAGPFGAIVGGILGSAIGHSVNEKQNKTSE